jgi:hypothetical protein
MPSVTGATQSRRPIMSQEDTKFTTAISRASTSSLFPRGLTTRMQGPGGYYNIGNALGLSAGIAVQFFAARAEADASLVDVVREYLVGSPGATALSIAMIMFFVSGEMYHRAGDARTGPAVRMMRRADFLSGVAALVLAIALVLFGSLWLALVSTVLLAGGKLGNALSSQGCWPVRVEYLGLAKTTLSRELDLFRLAPLLSRISAIVAILTEIVRLLAIGSPGTVLHLSQSTVLLICYLLWGRADLLLLRR